MLTRTLDSSSIIQGATHQRSIVPLVLWCCAHFKQFKKCRFIKEAVVRARALGWQNDHVGELAGHSTGVAKAQRIPVNCL
jgi:hypothetical protein